MLSSTERFPQARRVHILHNERPNRGTCLEAVDLLVDAAARAVEDRAHQRGPDVFARDSAHLVHRAARARRHRPEAAAARLLLRMLLPERRTEAVRLRGLARRGVAAHDGRR